MRRRSSERGAVAPASLLAAAVVIVAIGTAGYAITAGPSEHLEQETPLAQTTPTPTPSPSAKATHKTTPRPSPSPTPTAVEISRNTFDVGIYNQSSITGLAGRTGTKATTIGWKVVATNQWRGATVSATTVFYPPAMKLAAEQLAKDLGIANIQPSTQSMQMDQLTVVLTADYQG